MTFETSYEPDSEQVTITLDDSMVLQATLGLKGELKLNPAFKKLENQHYELYVILLRFIKDLLKLTSV